MLKLCSELDIYYKREGKEDFIHHVSSTVITPFHSFPLILVYASHIFNQLFPKKFIKNLIKENFVVVYFTDKVPVDALISESIIYIKAKWRYFDVGTIKNINLFTAVSGVEKKGEKTALQIAKVYRKPFIRTISDLNKVKKIYEEENKNVTILFDTIFEVGDRGLGDILLTTPIVKALKEKFNAKVTYAVRPEGVCLLENNPDIERIVTRYDQLDRSRYTYHLPLIRHTENYKIARNRQNRIDSMAELFMVKLNAKNKKSLYYITDEELAYTKSNIKRTHKIKVGINIEATAPVRRWKESYLFKLLEKMDKNKFEFYLFGAGQRMNYTNLPKYVNNFVNKTTLRESIALFSQMDLALTSDSLYSHVAGAFDIPQVTIYTSIPAEWRNLYYRSIGIQGQTECCPCCDFQFIKKEDYEKCNRYGTPRCVLSITSERVKEGIEKCVKRYSIKMRKKIKQILINRSSGLGDILMITSFLNSLRKVNKEAYIAFRTNHTEILKYNKDVDDIIYGNYVEADKLENLFNNYDEVYNFDYTLESPGVSGSLAKITDWEYMNIPRFDLIYKWAKMKMPKEIKMYYYVNNTEKKNAKKIVSSLDRFRKTILYVVNSTSPYRTYPVEKTLNVVEKLLKNYNVITVGNNLSVWTMNHYFNKKFYGYIEKFEYDNFLDLVDKTNLRTLFALVKEVDCCITPDTGTLHIANVMNTPCVALFGNIDPKLRTKYYKQTIALYKNISCAKNCGDRGKLIREFNYPCPCKKDIERHMGKIGGTCMEKIEEKEILQAVESIIKGKVKNECSIFTCLG